MAARVAALRVAVLGLDLLKDADIAFAELAQNIGLRR